MTSRRVSAFFAVIGLLVALAALSAFPVSAAPSESDADSADLGPTTDEIRPDPYPLLNELNPASPYYDPSQRYGGEGTRFGPPGQRRDDLSILALATDEWFGTQIYPTLQSGQTCYGARAKQSVSTTLTLDHTNDYLYAPTLMAPATNLTWVTRCPLEAVTFYHKISSGMERKWKVWRHVPTEQFVYSTDINSTFLNAYVRSGYYYTKVEKIGTTWYACLWNYNNNVWDSKWTSTAVGDHTEGWDVWEEDELSDSWPSLPKIRSYDLRVNINQTWVTVTSTHGWLNDGLDADCPYDRDMTIEFHDWYVGP